MKVVAIEEHWTSPEIRRAWAALAPDQADESLGILRQFGIGERLEDTGADRLARMDEMGIDIQVLSLGVPGLHNFAPRQAVELGRHANDMLAAVVARHPDRYQGFAALPTAAPEQAADELARSVEGLGFRGALIHGRTGGRNMDAPEFEPIYQTAARLGVPLYLHPQIPSPAVREAYYGGFSKPVEIALATGGLGWHYETGLQFIRLILAGTLDRYPDLQFILGHWGEMVLFYLDRIQLLDVSARLDRPIRDYFLHNAYYTPSGIFSQRDLQRTVATVGAERVMFSTDYPYKYSLEAGFDPAVADRWINLGHVRDGGARRFLDQAVLTQAHRAMIAHGNWDRLTARQERDRLSLDRGNGAITL